MRSSVCLFIHHSSLRIHHFLLPRLHQLVAHRDALFGDDEEAPRLVEREARGRVCEHVAVLAKLVADGLRRIARVVDGEDAPARPLRQLLYDLVRLQAVAAERPARAVGNLQGVDRYVAAQDFVEDLVEVRAAPAVEPVCDEHDDALVCRGRVRAERVRDHGRERVEEVGLAALAELGQRRLDLLRVVRPVRDDLGVLVVAYDLDLVALVNLVSELARRLLQLLHVRAKAQGVVDEYDYARGAGVGREALYVLLHAPVVEREFFRGHALVRAALARGDDAEEDAALLADLPGGAG